MLVIICGREQEIHIVTNNMRSHPKHFVQLQRTRTLMANSDSDGHNIQLEVRGQGTGTNLKNMYILWTENCSPIEVIGF